MEKEDSTRLRLEGAAHYFAAKFCEARAATLGKEVSRQGVAMLTDIFVKFLDNYSKDIELFAKHRKKKTINRRLLLDEVNPTVPQADEISGRLFSPPYVTLPPPSFTIRPDELFWTQPLIHQHMPLWDYSMTHPSIHKTYLSTAAASGSSASTSSNSPNPPASPVKDPHTTSPSVASKYPPLDKDQVLALLQQAVANPLPPGQNQQLITALESNPKYAIDGDISPKKLPYLIESNPLVAIQLLLAIMNKAEAIDPYRVPTFDSMEVINRLARAVELPHDFLNNYITHCLQQCQLHKDKYQQTRLVRLVCVFLQSLIQNHLWDVSDLFNEVQTFCIEFSRTREAAALFALLKQLESDGSIKVDPLSTAIASANNSRH